MTCGAKVVRSKTLINTETMYKDNGSKEGCLAYSFAISIKLAKLLKPNVNSLHIVSDELDETKKLSINHVEQKQKN